MEGPEITGIREKAFLPGSRRNNPSSVPTHSRRERSGKISVTRLAAWPGVFFASSGKRVIGPPGRWNRFSPWSLPIQSVPERSSTTLPIWVEERELGFCPSGRWRVKDSRSGSKEHSPLRGGDPQGTPAVHEEIVDPAVEDGVGIAGDGLEYLELPAVEAVEAVLGAEPQEALAVLDDAVHRAERQPLGDGQALEPHLARQQNLPQRQDQHTHQTQRMFHFGSGSSR